MAQLVAQTYAKALYEVALESDRLESFQEELSFIVETFKQYPDFYELCRTPQLSLEEKKQIVENVFSGRLTAEIVNFLKVLLDKRRITSLEEIAREYRKLINEYNNVVEGVAVTAVALKEDQKAKLEEKLGKLTGKKIRLRNEIDPSIIGGILVRVEDKVIDGTVQRRLNELKESFAQIIV